MARSVREGSFDWWNVNASAEGLKEELQRMEALWRAAGLRPKRLKYVLTLGG